MDIDVRSKPERTYQKWLKESILSSYVSAYVGDPSTGTQPIRFASTCIVPLTFCIGWQRVKPAYVRSAKGWYNASSLCICPAVTATEGVAERRMERCLLRFDICYGSCG